LLNVEDDEAGRLAGFRARFGRGFDIKETTGSGEAQTAASEEVGKRPPAGKDIELDENGFGEEDANLLELISSYGQAEDAQSRKKGGRR
jgi:hypothetical protein